MSRRIDRVPLRPAESDGFPCGHVERDGWDVTVTSGQLYAGDGMITVVAAVRRRGILLACSLRPAPRHDRSAQERLAADAATEALAVAERALRELTAPTGAPATESVAECAIACVASHANWGTCSDTGEAIAVWGETTERLADALRIAGYGDALDRALREDAEAA